MIYVEAVRPATKSEIEHGKVEQDCHETFAEVLQRAIRWTKNHDMPSNAMICDDMPKGGKK